MLSDRLMRPGMVLSLALLWLTMLPATSPADEAMVGVTAGSSPEMVRFDSSAPGTIVARAPVQGLLVGETVSAIDQRPQIFSEIFGEIFALTSNNRVLRLDPRDGTVIALGATAGTFAAQLAAGVDFNPVTDRLRLVNPPNDNARFNPVSLTYVQDDTDLSYIATDPNVGVDPNVIAAAHDRNDNNGVTQSTLFGIDSTLDILVRQGAIDGNAADVPGGGNLNNGLLTTLGSLAIDVDDAAFDIATPSAGGSDTAYLATHTPAAASSVLRTVNLPGTAPVGATTSLGAIGASTLSAMAVIHGGSVRVAGNATLVSEADAQALVHVERVGDTLAPIQLMYETADRTAIAGLDYQATSGWISFAAGESAKDIPITLLGDSELEATEAFVVDFTSPGPATVLDAHSRTVAISDDDAAPGPPSSPPAKKCKKGQKLKKGKCVKKKKKKG